MPELQIRKSIVIRDQEVYLNGELQLSGEEPAAAFFKQIYKHYGIKYGKFFKMDKLSKLGFIASELLLMETDQDAWASEETGVILCNYSSSLNTDKRYQETMADIASPAVFVYTLPNIVIGEICIRNGFQGENGFFIQKQFDFEFAENYTQMLFEMTPMKQCILGWVEMDMDDNYDACLYLVEKGTGLTGFTVSNLQQIFRKG